MKKKKVFLFDCDGVLLDLWKGMRKAYAKYIGRDLNDFSEEEWVAIIHDFIRDRTPYLDFGIKFDNSESFKNLPPCEGMVEFVRFLKSEGWDIVVITSCSISEEVQKARLENLINVFGDVFTAVHCVHTGGKGELIKKYAEEYEYSVFADDMPHNVNEAVGVVSLPIWVNSEALANLEDQVSEKAVKVLQPMDIRNVLQAA